MKAYSEGWEWSSDSIDITTVHNIIIVGGIWGALGGDKHL